MSDPVAFRTSLSRAVTAEVTGTALLLAAIVGSGIMGESLSNGNAALALLANSLATGAMLVALIFTFAPISGAHFNPVVSLAARVEGTITGREAAAYILGQAMGAVLGVMTAQAMFSRQLLELSVKNRSGGAQIFSEIIATFGLLVVIHSTGRRAGVVPLTVGAYITAAYWFTSSTSFANPAVTLARSLTDTFSGIRWQDVPGFIGAQLLGACAATLCFRWLNSRSAKA